MKELVNNLTPLTPGQMAERGMWKIFVPTVMNGKPIKTRFHKVWDRQVYMLTGGLTILTPTKGKWVSPEGAMFDERMIPVLVMCTREQIQQIVTMTLGYYQQRAVLAYRVSSEVILKYADVSA